MTLEKLPMVRAVLNASLINADKAIEQDQVDTDA